MAYRSKEINMKIDELIEDLKEEHKRVTEVLAIAHRSNRSYLRGRLHGLNYVLNKLGEYPDG